VQSLLRRIGLVGLFNIVIHVNGVVGGGGGWQQVETLLVDWTVNRLAIWALDGALLGVHL
jgi:hypothetical protein